METGFGEFLKLAFQKVGADVEALDAHAGRARTDFVVREARFAGLEPFTERFQRSIMSGLNR